LSAAGGLVDQSESFNIRAAANERLVGKDWSDWMYSANQLNGNQRDLK